MTEKKTTPFDYINAINRGVNIPVGSGYAQFMINRGFSLYPDTILMANEANLRWKMTDEQHFTFMRSIIRAGFRKQKKWPKSDKSGNAQLISNYFPRLSYEKAKEIEPLFSKEMLDKMEADLYSVT